MSDWYKKGKEERKEIDQKKQEEKLAKEKFWRPRIALMKALYEKVKLKVDQVNRETTYRFYLKDNSLDLEVLREITFSIYLDTGDDRDRPFLKIAAQENGFFRSLNYAKIEGRIDDIWYYKEKKEIKTEPINLETISEEEIHKWFGELIDEQEKRERFEKSFSGRIGGRFSNALVCVLILTLLLVVASVYFSFAMQN